MLHVQPLPPELDLPGYESLVCWDTRSDGDAGVQWLQARIAAIVEAAD